MLESAVALRTFLKADEPNARMWRSFIAEHFKQNVLPLGYKAFVVAVNREACAKYKRELDKLLPPNGRAYILTECRRHDRSSACCQICSFPNGARKTNIRRPFQEARSKIRRLLIVTDKLFTGYDAPLLYCLYLDKPMRDHVLFQAIARVNRPYEDDAASEEGWAGSGFCRRTARTEEGIAIRLFGRKWRY